MSTACRGGSAVSYCSWGEDIYVTRSNCSILHFMDKPWRMCYLLGSRTSLLSPVVGKKRGSAYNPTLKSVNNEDLQGNRSIKQDLNSTQIY